jgi:hypothetical protein
MMASPRRRADGRGTTRPRTLACTADGVWLWPGTPLTQRRGTALVPLRTPQLYELVAAFHGAGVHAPSLARTVQSAAACLNLGRAREAAQIVAALDLPPVSFEGAALMRGDRSTARARHAGGGGRGSSRRIGARADRAARQRPRRKVHGRTRARAGLQPRSLPRGAEHGALRAGPPPALAGGSTRWRPISSA